MPAPTLPSENPAAVVVNPSGYALEFDNVSIAFDEKVVLDGISFQLPHGEPRHFSASPDRARAHCSSLQ